MTDDQRLLRCSHCSWVHFEAIPSDFLPGAESRLCFRCYAPSTDMEPCTADAVLPGVTVQPVIYDYHNAEHYRARSAILDEMAAIDQELGLE